MLPKETVSKTSASSPKKLAVPASPTSDDMAATEVKTAKRKPRKLNKDATSTPAETVKSPISSKTLKKSSSTSELEALKTRVRELEAKVEDLYKTGATLDSRAGRSPRRRGKGRKASSTAQLSRTNTIESDTGASDARVQAVPDDYEEADEELVRLEGELEVARQDLEHYRPRARRTRSNETEYVQEIPRSTGGTAAERQVTLSGSYRIPIPASVG
jgi:predicted  nucleic acid-binding Zn-ribbon protein